MEERAKELLGRAKEIDPAHGDKAEMLIGGQREYAVRGSRRYVCGDCFAEVWVAPSGQKIVERDKPKIVCLPCSLKIMDASDEPAKLMTAPMDEVMEEIRTFQRDEERKRK